MTEELTRDDAPILSKQFVVFVTLFSFATVGAAVFIESWGMRRGLIFMMGTAWGIIVGEFVDVFQDWWVRENQGEARND